MFPVKDSRKYDFYCIDWAYRLISLRKINLKTGK